MRAEWTLPALLGYLDTWSATRRYRAANGDDPLATLEPRLVETWGDVAQRRQVARPLFLLVGDNVVQ